MTVYCKHGFLLREEDKRLELEAGFTGQLPEWAEKHWMIQAAIQDGTILSADKPRPKRKDT